MTTTPRVAREGLLMGETGPRPGATISGDALLVVLTDAEAAALQPTDILVTRFAYGWGPVVVDAVRSSVAGEDGALLEVPVVVAFIPTGQRLAFAPEELFRVQEVRS